MGLIVNSDAGVVTGFTGITAHIDEVNAKSVLFNGTTTHPSGAEWSVRGAMDMTTGSVGATVTWFNPKANTLLMRSQGQAQTDPRVQKSMELLRSMTAKFGAPKIEGTEQVGGKDAPALYFGSTKLNNSFEIVDAIGREDGKGMTATLFVKG